MKQNLNTVCPVCWLKNIFQRPFPVMQDWKMRMLIILFHGVFVVFFLLLFKPFQNIFTPDQPIMNAGFGLVVSGVLAFNHLICALSNTDFSRWTIGKSVLWTMYDLLTVIVGVFIYKNYWTNFEYFSWIELLNIGSATLLLAIIPVIISTTLLENWLLRSNLRQAQQLQDSVEQSEKKRQQTPQSVTTIAKQEDVITLFSENKGEWLKVRPSDLIYLESSDNYVEIHYGGADGVHKKLLRSSLTRIEQQIKPTFIQRCHRSYIVNLRKIQYVDGNSRGLLLAFLDIDKKIPVSRKYVKTILGKIEETQSV